jgi:hypothetical protein
MTSHKVSKVFRRILSRMPEDAVLALLLLAFIFVMIAGVLIFRSFGGYNG